MDLIAYILKTSVDFANRFATNVPWSLFQRPLYQILPILPRQGHFQVLPALERKNLQPTQCPQQE